MIKTIVASIMAIGVLLVSSGSVDAQSKTGSYAALGDSVAAGAGLRELPVTQQYPNPSAQCGRSDQAYPHLVAQQTGLRLMHIACNGATAGDLVTKQGQLPAQLDAAFSQGTPQLITITAGANDAQWASFIYRCYQGDCATKTNEALAKGLIETSKLKLQYALGEIQKRSNGNPPQVIVTGYYNPVSNYCKGKQSYASNAEINFLNKQRDNLNKSIREAAKPYAFVKYASSNFDRHGLCAKEPWSQGINDKAPLHPNEKGQQKIAESVLSKYRR